jgi:hypothetical protein
MKILRFTLLLLAVFSWILKADSAWAQAEYEPTAQSIRETNVAGRRGFQWLEYLFKYQSLVWQAYVPWAAKSVRDINGLIGKEHLPELQALDKHVEDLEKQRYTVHALVFNMGASPAALDLEKKVEKVFWTVFQKYQDLGTIPYEKRTGPPMTKDELIALDKELDGFIVRMKNLPKLSPAEAKKEYEEYTPTP